MLSSFDQVIAEGLITTLQKETAPFLEKNKVNFFSDELFKVFFRTDIGNFFNSDVVEKNTDIFVGQILLSDRASFAHMKPYSDGIVAVKNKYGVSVSDETRYDLFRKEFQGSFIAPPHRLETVNSVLGLLSEKGHTIQFMDDRCRISDKSFRKILDKNKKHTELQRRVQEEFYKLHIARHFFTLIEKKQNA